MYIQVKMGLGEICLLRLASFKKKNKVRVEES